MAGRTTVTKKPSEATTAAPRAVEISGAELLDPRLLQKVSAGTPGGAALEPRARAGQRPLRADRRAALPL